MTQQEVIEYWISTSEKDFQTMERLFSGGDNAWALFLGHLVIEKLLKAYYAKTKNVSTPFHHNLTRIAAEAGLELSEERKTGLSALTTFNINARYPDYKQQFYEKCDALFTLEKINLVNELRKWLLELIRT